MFSQAVTIAIWWSYHVPLNYVWTLLFGGLTEKLLLIMWSSGQNYIFLCKNARQYFFAANFCNFELFYYQFVTIFINIFCHHFEKRSHGTYLKEHISAFEKIFSIGHFVILPLKHCICRKKFYFDQLLVNIW